MILYTIIFNLMVLGRYALSGKERLRNQLYPYLLILLFAFVAFRFNVGCDWSGYLNQFRIQGASTLQESLENLEPLWWLMMGGIHWLDLPYPWVNVAAASIFFVGVHFLARRQPDRLGFLILLFPILIINMPMSGIRQGAAIGIMCFAFTAFLDKKLFWFLGWTLVASMFHSSAIVFLLLAPLVNGTYGRTRLILAAGLALPGAYILATGAAVDQATLRYIGTGLDSAGAAFRVGLLLLTGAGFFLLLNNKWKRFFPQDFKLVNIGALMMVAMIVLVPLSTVVGDRLGYYLVPIQAIILSRIPYLSLGASRHIYIAAPYLGLVAVFAIWTSLSGHFQLCYIPYDTWILGLPDEAYDSF